MELMQLDAPLYHFVALICSCINIAHFVITGELGNIWLGRMVLVGTMEKVANIPVFVFCCCADLLSEWLQKTQVFPVYPIKELLMLLLHNTSAIFILVPFVQQQLSHLCDASKTFYMLDTLKHSNSAKKKTETELKCKVKIHRLSS